MGSERCWARGPRTGEKPQGLGSFWGTWAVWGSGCRVRHGGAGQGRALSSGLRGEEGGWPLTTCPHLPACCSPTGRTRMSDGNRCAATWADPPRCGRPGPWTPGNVGSSLPPHPIPLATGCLQRGLGQTLVRTSRPFNNNQLMAEPAGERDASLGGEGMGVRGRWAPLRRLT